MAGYRDELERLNFSAEEKEALTCRLLERRSGQEEKRPRFPYRGLVAIVAAASLLTGAVGAVSLAGVSPAFRELFGITSEEQAKNLGIVQMNQVFEDKNGSGATVTVKEAPKKDLVLESIWGVKGASISVGEEATMRVTADGETVDDSLIKWSTANPSIATVDASGVVKGVASGSTDLIAEVYGQTLTVTVIVDDPD